MKQKVAVKFRRGPSGDSPDFPWVLKKALPAELPVKLVVADKGYDAESNHEYAQVVLGARTAIPVRAANRPKIKMRGKRRKKQAKDFDREGYDCHRPKVETVFSVEKRTTGSIVLARVSSRQHKELIFRAFSYNSGRLETLFFCSSPRISTQHPSLHRTLERILIATVRQAPIRGRRAPHDDSFVIWSQGSAAIKSMHSTDA